MTRYRRRQLIHLGISAPSRRWCSCHAISSGIPAPLFEAAGGLELFLLILAVDVTLGPLITLIVFVPGKRGLKFDLWSSAILQLARSSPTASTSLAESRPVYIVFVKDRFELVRANEIADAELERRPRTNRFATCPGPGRASSGARLPDGPRGAASSSWTRAIGGKRHPVPIRNTTSLRRRSRRGRRASARRWRELRELNPRAVGRRIARCSASGGARRSCASCRCAPASSTSRCSSMPRTASVLDDRRPEALGIRMKRNAQASTRCSSSSSSRASAA